MSRPSQSSKSAAKVTPKKTGPPLVYVVDDEPMFGQILEAILQLEGCETCVFQSPQQALAAIEAASPKPELLLTDFVMPGMNGLELIEHSRKSCPELKTILFSGGFSSEIMAYYPTKPDEFLAKPFQPKVLAEMIKAVLAK
jgi:DNA-binding NtrC family response regulator